MLIDAGPVRLNLSAMIQCFSLTTKQHQPAYKPQKRSSEQGDWWFLQTWCLSDVQHG